MTHYDIDTIRSMDVAYELARELELGDTVDCPDDGSGRGRYLEGCGGDRDWDDLERKLRARGLRLEDVGGYYKVVDRNEEW